MANTEHLATWVLPEKPLAISALQQQCTYVIAVEVEMVISTTDPCEPCLESETVQLLREIKEHADKEDLDWLTKRGKVYTATPSN